MPGQPKERVDRLDGKTWNPQEESRMRKKRTGRSDRNQPLGLMFNREKGNTGSNTQEWTVQGTGREHSAPKLLKLTKTFKQAVEEPVTAWPVRLRRGRVWAQSAAWRQKN